MTVLKPLAVRLLTLVAVLFLVLVALVVTLGATGFSDRLLEAQIGEDLRGLRVTLSQTIRDPEQLEATLDVRRQELVEFYDLDQSWVRRLPATVARVITLDLGEARSLKSFSGSREVSDIVWDRLPNTASWKSPAPAREASVPTATGAEPPTTPTRLSPRRRLSSPRTRSTPAPSGSK